MAGQRPEGLRIGGLLAETRACAYQTQDMELLMRMVQQVGDIVQAAGLFEATGRARKAHRPVLAFRAEGVGGRGLGTGD